MPPPPPLPQGKLLEGQEAVNQSDDDDDDDEDDPALCYEMDPNFYHESSSVSSVVNLNHAQPIWMGAANAVQFTVIVPMTFEKKSASGSKTVVTGSRDVVLPIKVQTLKSAQVNVFLLGGEKEVLEQMMGRHERYCHSVLWGRRDENVF